MYIYIYIYNTQQIMPKDLEYEYFTSERDIWGNNSKT